MNKGWEFYDSEKGSSTQYNTITWSYNKSYGDKAEAWFYLFTYEGFPNKISYSVFNKPAYTKIQNTLKSNGYSLKDSEINDNNIISKYANRDYFLEISTEKREKKNDYSYYDESITAYNFQLIKKSGVYDPDNGNKTDYWYGGENIKAKYNLKDGKLDGKFTTYYYSGRIEKSGSYQSGIASGNFIVYDEDGNKSEEYLMQNDKKNGAYIGYYYNDEGELFLKINGNYIADSKSGIWKTIVIEDSGERTLEYENYKSGIKDGSFQEVSGDSLIIGYYKNDLLNGECKIYTDFSRMLFGGIIRTDISKLTLISEGNYYNNYKSGYWRNYDLTGSLKSEGKFINGKETGEWKYYYTSYVDNDGSRYPYSNELFLVQNYSNGIRNGKAIRYSYLDKEEYPCSEEDETKSSLDTCTRMVYQKVLETSFYKNDELHGVFELKDSIGELIAKGSFNNGLKQGDWLHRYSDSDLNGENYFIYQKGRYENDKREGKWIQYYNPNHTAKTFNYKNGELHGVYIEWNKFDKPSQKKLFEKGDFKELIVYDSLGINSTSKYEIYQNMFSYYKCRKTEYYDDGYASQEYWMKKDGEIDHSWYGLTFALATGKYSDGSKGYRDGAFKIFDETNNPLVVGKYFKENKVDLWTTYYYDQNVKVEVNYKNNYQTDEKYIYLNGQLYSGDFIHVDEDENVKELRKIRNGLRHGNTEIINMNTGKTIRKEKYKEGIRK
jgi:antitoxin component YwqK of YwqJK toxin-antitoxin module